MEHRCNQRISTDARVLIYKYGIPIAIGRIRNGTRYGLFIESDLADVGALQFLGIEILFYRHSHVLQRYKFDSIVTHTAEGGFGVELDWLDENINDVLFDVLHDKAAAPQETEFFGLVANG